MKWLDIPYTTSLTLNMFISIYLCISNMQSYFRFVCLVSNMQFKLNLSNKQPLWLENSHNIIWKLQRGMLNNNFHIQPIYTE